ncbi:ANTAR domain-containing protein [Paenibacillus chitinolyticus]|uniref:ANTAR domain-containing response regulator n=1 Tax=Paenibacillus chitinolyticus TaxID=79263 RepID=UPI002DB6FD15|nr:ANTAR domain-containing protein [Paenibacillus chitinolyticus]MEC0249577.1 ANTAR domain-containing protein [Paenibacillus chitinolyticus]
MRSILLIEDIRIERSRAFAKRNRSGAAALTAASPEEAILLCDCRLIESGIESVLHLAASLQKADAVLLAVPPSGYRDLLPLIRNRRSVPVLWWCDEKTFPPGESADLGQLDGLIGPGMNFRQLQSSMALALGRHTGRNRREEEKSDAGVRLQERQWIDRAKRIVIDARKISETEAYAFLRKQAMDQRRRMADVALAIVKRAELPQKRHPGDEN